MVSTPSSGSGLHHPLTLAYRLKRRLYVSYQSADHTVRFKKTLALVGAVSVKGKNDERALGATASSEMSYEWNAIVGTHIARGEYGIMGKKTSPGLRSLEALLRGVAFPCE
jgi:hypothetical protein